MIENLWVSSGWVALAVSVISYAAGYCLAFYEAYLYNTSAKNYLVLSDNYELAPGFQGIAFKHQVVNAKFLGGLLVLSVAILTGWWQLIQQYNRPDIFAFLMGGLLLWIAAASMHHFRNIVLFRHAQRGEGLEGRIKYSRRLVHTLSFTELYSFAALYFLMFLVSSSSFFLGGTLVCLLNGFGRNHWTAVSTSKRS